MDVNIGIDIAKKKCDYCVLDGAGGILERGQYANTIQDARLCAQELASKYRKKGTCRAACESTANMWRATYDAFESAGISIVLANPYKMALVTKDDKKTDKEDARKIADLLRVNMLHACHVPSLQVRGIRALIRCRIRLSQDRTKVINRIRSMLDAYSVTIQAAKLYSNKGMRQLEETDLGTVHDTLVLGKCVGQMRHLTEEISDLDRRLEAEAAQNEDARLLTSMPGVGPYVALLMAVEIDGIKRYKSPKKLVSMAGFCPHIKESGEESRTNRIKKKNTNKTVNWAMCEAAQVATRHDPRMAAAYESAKRRHANKHALGIIVVAHKMVTIMWHMLATRTPYQSRNEELYQRKLNRMRKARQRQE